MDAKQRVEEPSGRGWRRDQTDRVHGDPPLTPLLPVRASCCPLLLGCFLTAPLPRRPPTHRSVVRVLLSNQVRGGEAAASEGSGLQQPRAGLPSPELELAAFAGQASGAEAALGTSRRLHLGLTPLLRLLEAPEAPPSASVGSSEDHSSSETLNKLQIPETDGAQGRERSWRRCNRGDAAAESSDWDDGRG